LAQEFLAPRLSALESEPPVSLQLSAQTLPRLPALLPVWPVARALVPRTLPLFSEAR